MDQDLNKQARGLLERIVSTSFTEICLRTAEINAVRMVFSEWLNQPEKTASSQLSKSPDFRQAQVGGEHYKADVTPWDLQATMKTSGKVSVDARRADVIKYVWRIKGDRAKQIEDLKKAAHCLQAAIETLSNP